MKSSSSTAVRCFTGGFTATNGYVFQAPAGLVGVDAPEGFADWLASEGIKLHALLLTHAHFDHVVDAAAIHVQHGCPIYAWEVSTPESRLETFLWQAAGMKFSVADYAVDFLLEGKSSITVCGVDIQLAHIPGHSLDSVAFIDLKDRRAFTGDTLMAGTMGRTDFPGGSTQILLSGIRQHLLTLPDETEIYSGHGEPTTIGLERRWVQGMR